MLKRCCGSYTADRIGGHFVFPVIVMAILATASCASQASSPVRHKRPAPAPLAYFNEGKQFVIGVDVRAARLTGPSEFLPLQILLENHGTRPVRLDRESLVLERPDGMKLPICTSREFRRDYRRTLSDVHQGAAFMDTISGRFPDPPFRWQPLGFFPLQSEGAPPRDGIDVPLGNVVFGYVYFRQPNPRPEPLNGIYKLLLKLGGSDEEYVVEFIPYDLH